MQPEVLWAASLLIAPAYGWGVSRRDRIPQLLLSLLALLVLALPIAQWATSGWLAGS